VIETERRPMSRAVAFGLLVGVVGAAVGLLIVVMPLYGLARALEAGRGLGRPFIRDNLFRFAVPAGLVLGTISGAVGGRWYRHGGRLPRE
jgi:hypothetical protein